MDFERHGVMQQSIEDRGGDDAIAEDLTPGAEAVVAGEDHRAALVVSRDQLEEQVCTEPVDRQVSDLVDDRQARGRVDFELLIETGRRPPAFE